MRRVINLTALLLALLPLCGCRGAAATTLTVAQSLLEPYSFYVEGSAQGVLGVNPKFLALDATVDVKVQYRGPENDVLGAPIVVRWEKTFQRGGGKRAYKAVFNTQGRFIEVMPASWSEARASMPFLPPE